MATSWVEVSELLPGEMGDGWTEDKVTQMINEGQSKAKILARAWEVKAAKTYELIDINESGTSRSLSKVHDNALNMVKHYGDIAAKEDEKTNSGAPRSRNHRAVRV